MSSKKILFATMPFDGHFSPLTGLALHLKKIGHDVRWYAGSIHEEKITRLGLRHYAFQHALEVNQENLDSVFPGRKEHTSTIAKLNFDLENVFLLRGAEYFADISDIHQTFPFDVLIADAGFSGIPFVREKLNVPVISIGVFPLMESSIDLAPYGLGLTPSQSFFGRRKQDLLRFICDTFLFRHPNRLKRKIFREHGIRAVSGNIFDALIRKSTLCLQSGAPGFEYDRSDFGANVRFIGALLPPPTLRTSDINWKDKVKGFKKVILVTQGTVEKDVSKILIPTLDALRNTPYLVVATTGGSNTAELRVRYPQANFIIEDFIPFADVMPYVNVYISNGGYGGVLLSIQHRVPMVVAGVHEGKNEINARVGYFNLGINLNTEKPSAKQISDSVNEVFDNPLYHIRVAKLSAEFAKFNPHERCAQYVEEVCAQQHHRHERKLSSLAVGLSDAAMMYR